MEVVEGCNFNESNFLPSSWGGGMSVSEEAEFGFNNEINLVLPDGVKCIPP